MISSKEGSLEIEKLKRNFSFIGMNISKTVEIKLLQIRRQEKLINFMVEFIFMLD